MKRRDFLLGVSALAVAAAIPSMRAAPSLIAVTYTFTYDPINGLPPGWKQLTPEVRKAA